MYKSQILKIIIQCQVKYINTLLVKLTMSVLNVSTYIVMYFYSVTSMECVWFSLVSSTNNTDCHDIYRLTAYMKGQTEIITSKTVSRTG
jgi:hypothetical protein